jgi:hypothetical protein
MKSCVIGLGCRTPAATRQWLCSLSRPDHQLQNAVAGSLLQPHPWLRLLGVLLGERLRLLTQAALPLLVGLGSCRDANHLEFDHS